MCATMTQLAGWLDEAGWTLRSGHAPGADRAFEDGAAHNAEVYLPWPSFERSEPLEAKLIKDRPAPWAYPIAADLHPAWDKLSRGARSLHARNVHQVLGPTPEAPVSRFVLCWTPDAGEIGGTGQAMRIARGFSVPVYNLADHETFDRILRARDHWIEEAEAAWHI